MTNKIPDYLKVWGTEQGQSLMRSMMKGGPMTEQDKLTAEQFRQLNKRVSLNEDRQDKQLKLF